MKLNRTGSIWNRNERNNLNHNWDIIEERTDRIDALVGESKNILAETKRVNATNSDVQNQIDDLIISKGESDAETIQARGSYALLYERLNASDKKLANTQRVLNVKTFGAKGDGITDDTQAIQNAIYEAELKGGNVYIPSGDYLIKGTLRTRHATTPHYTIGIRIYGDGKQTILRGNGASTVDYSDLKRTDKGAIFALHSGNNIIEDLCIKQTVVGIFFGQHPSTTEPSSASFNVIRNVWMEYVGTGILMVHAYGNNYNKFDNIHIISCQIGVHLAKGTWIDRVNNNRNNLKNIRVSTGWIAYLIEDADGNSFDSLYAENLVNNGGLVGGAPEFLPADLLNKPTGVIVLGGQLNFFDKVAFENCAFHIYSVGFRTSFENLMVKDDTSTPLIMFPDKTRLPYYYFANSTILPFLQYQPTSGVLHNGSNGAAITSRLFDLDYHWQSADVVSLSSNIQDLATASRSKFRKLGGEFLWQTNIRFTKTSTTASTDKIKIKIPKSDVLKIDEMYAREVSSLVTFTFQVYVGFSGNIELAKARFSTATEATNLGAPHLIIDAPKSGWIDGQFNNIVFDIRFYAE